MQPIITVPTLSQQEVEDIAALVTDEKWLRSMKPVLQRVVDSAQENQDRLNQSLEFNGYYKGIKILAKDLLNMAKEIAKHITVAPDKEPGQL